MDLLALYDVQAQHLRVKELTASQKAEVKARYIEDQLLYHEALRLGLDKGDSIVKRRLIQKMLFLAQQFGGAKSTATEKDLRAHYQKTKSQWKRPAMFGFAHIFVKNADLPRLQKLRQQAIRFTFRNLQPSSRPTTQTTFPPALGDAFPLGQEITPTPLPKLRSLFGDSFVDALRKLRPAAWSQPIRSKMGHHLVYIQTQQPAAQASYAEIFDQLQFDYLLQRRRQIQQELLRRLTTRYRIQWVAE